MYKARLKCEVITPLFMAGGEGRKPELKPFWVKGVMRFLGGGVKGGDDIFKL